MEAMNKTAVNSETRFSIVLFIFIVFKETPITCSAKNGFLCENNECVSREKRCDSFADCSDKSDEFNCRQS